MFIRKRVEILCSGCRFRNQAFVISFGNWQFWKNEDDEMEGDYTESQLEEIQAQTQTEDDDDDDVIQLDGELLFVKTNLVLFLNFLICCNLVSPTPISQIPLLHVHVCQSDSEVQSNYVLHVLPFCYFRWLQRPTNGIACGGTPGHSAPSLHHSLSPVRPESPILCRETNLFEQTIGTFYSWCKIFIHTTVHKKALLSILLHISTSQIGKNEIYSVHVCFMHVIPVFLRKFLLFLYKFMLVAYGKLITCII